MAAQMEQPFPLDPDDDLQFNLADLIFSASGEGLATFDHKYEDGDGLEVYDSTLNGASVDYRARLTDSELPNGTVRSVTFHLVGNGSPPQKRDRTVYFVVRRSSGGV